MNARPRARWCVIGALGLAAGTGCAHRQLARVPSPAEIEEINASVDPSVKPPMMIDYRPEPLYLSRDPQPVRPISDQSVVEIQRVVAADPLHLTVVDGTGRSRTLDADFIQGVTVRRPKLMSARYAGIGGLVGLGISGLLVLSYDALRNGADQPVSSGPPTPVPVAAEVAVVAVSTVVCAVLGAIVGQNDRGGEVFTFGPPPAGR